MIIKNPSITDIHRNDFVSIKKGKTRAITCDKKYTYIFNYLTNTEDISSYEDDFFDEYVYEVVEVNTAFQSVVIRGYINKKNPDYTSSNRYSSKYEYGFVTVAVDQIETVYSQLPNNEFENHVLAAYTKFSNEYKQMFYSLIPENIADTNTKYTNEFEYDTIEDHILYGDYGFYSTVEDSIGKGLFTFGDYIPGTNNREYFIVFNPKRIAIKERYDNEIDEEIEDRIKSILKDFTEQYNQLVKIDFKNLVSSNNELTSADFDTIRSGIDKYYQWCFDIFGHLVNVDIETSNNENINKQIKQYNDEIKSCEYQIKNLYSKIESLKNSIAECEAKLIK